MIHYKVAGSIVRYDNPDKSDIHSFEEVFQDSNPLTARQKAIKFYNDYLLSIQEAGQKIEDKITKGGDLIDDIGLGIGIYLEITDPYEKLWDKVYLPYHPSTGLGTELESEESDINEGDFQWVILGRGDGIFATAPWFIKGLENEIEIYNQFNYHKGNLETTVPCFDHNDKKIKEHSILKIQYNWNEYNIEQVNDSNNLIAKKTDPEIGNYLEWIKKGEGEQIEFKSTLFYSESSKKKEEYIKLAVGKTIAAFLNSRGGTLFIGVNDKREVIGLENDYKLLDREDKQDSFKQMFDNIVKTYIGNQNLSNIRGSIHTYNGMDFMRVEVSPSKKPVFLINEKKEKGFYVRSTSSSQPLDIEEAINYILEKFNSQK